MVQLFAISVYFIMCGYLMKSVWNKNHEASNEFLDGVLYSNLRKHMLQHNSHVDPFPLAGFVLEFGASGTEAQGNDADTNEVPRQHRVYVSTPGCEVRFYGGTFTGFSRVFRHGNCSDPFRPFSWSNNVSVTCTLGFNDLAAHYDVELKHAILPTPLRAKAICLFDLSLVSMEMTHDPFRSHQPDVSDMRIQHLGAVTTNFDLLVDDPPPPSVDGGPADFLKDTLAKTCATEFRNILKHSFLSVFRESLYKTILPRPR